MSLLLALLRRALPPVDPPAPSQDEPIYRAPVVGRGPGTTIGAADMRRQAHHQRRRTRRQREDMLFL